MREAICNVGVVLASALMGGYGRLLSGSDYQVDMKRHFSARHSLQVMNRRSICGLVFGVICVYVDGGCVGD